MPFVIVDAKDATKILIEAIVFLRFRSNYLTDRCLRTTAQTSVREVNTSGSHKTNYSSFQVTTHSTNVHALVLSIVLTRSKATEEPHESTLEVTYLPHPHVLHCQAAYFQLFFDHTLRAGPCK